MAWIRNVPLIAWLVAGTLAVVAVAYGIFGASLFYGDAVLTPAISVLSAVEGLTTINEDLASFVVPITLAILVALFSAQSRGTARMGSLFGPIMVLWFGTLALSGVHAIAGEPTVLAALWPGHALSFVLHGGWTALVVLGSVFLVCTGGEALYADMGHFGRPPKIGRAHV